MVEKEGGWRKCRGSSDGECQDRRKGKVVSLRREPRVQMNLNGRASREIVEPVSRKVRDQLGICTYSSCICVHTLFFRRLCIFFVPIPPTRSLSIRRCIVPSVLPPFRGPEINNGLPPLTQQKKNKPGLREQHISKDLCRAFHSLFAKCLYTAGFYLLLFRQPRGFVASPSNLKKHFQVANLFFFFFFFFQM